jgi:hydroxyquinol 1,2-dioxygenase
MLNAANRSPMRPAHVHFMVTAPGYQTLITHVFEAGDPHLDLEAVFAVKSSLITNFERHEPGTAPDGKQMDVPFSSGKTPVVWPLESLSGLRRESHRIRQ